MPFFAYGFFSFCMPLYLHTNIPAAESTPQLTLTVNTVAKNTDVVSLALCPAHILPKTQSDGC